MATRKREGVCKRRKEEGVSEREKEIKRGEKMKALMKSQILNPDYISFRVKIEKLLF